jgi:hypothetical protein
VRCVWRAVGSDLANDIDGRKNMVSGGGRRVLCCLSDGPIVLPNNSCEKVNAYCVAC